MTYAVMDECIKYKYKDCIEGCLVDCFYQDEKMIVIKTEECIGCAVCETEYPVDVIKPDTISDAAKWIAFNQKYIGFWPNISEKDVWTSDTDDWADVPDRLAHLSKNSAQQ